MEKENNKRNPAYLLIGIFLIAFSMLSLMLFYGKINNAIEATNTKIEEFNSPYWINDSTVHMNISENICMLFEINDGTCYVTTNGAEHIIINDNVITLLYHEAKDFKVKEIFLDSIEGLTYSELYIN